MFFYSAHAVVTQHLQAEFSNRPALDFGGPFFTLAIKEGASENLHIDFNDDVRNLAWVIPLGDWQGAELCVPQLGAKIPICPGQILAFDAKLLAHSSAPIIHGRRIVLTLFSDYVILKRGD